MDNLNASSFTDGRNLDKLKSWNNAQSTPDKVKYFTFVIQNKNDAARVIATLEKNYPCHGAQPNTTPPFYAWILHNNDRNDDGTLKDDHWHFYCEFASPRSFKSVANELQIPVTELQKVYSKKHMRRYLTHEGFNDKYQYSDECVHANYDFEQVKKLEERNIIQEFEDYLDFKRGKITYRDFLAKYSMYLTQNTFNSLLKTYDMMASVVCKQEERDEVRHLYESKFGPP